MSDARRLSIGDLRQIVSDGEELKKGTAIFDANGLEHLSRYQGRLFCDAKGSGPAPYKVGLSFADDGSVKPRCSCIAARSRPFCKHATALLVAWARAPESFVVSDTAPPEVAAGGGGAKKKSVKKGQGSAAELMRQGVERVGTLVRELGLSGAASSGGDRVAQIRALGESLREHKLRRLSARTLELADRLARGVDGPAAAIEYMDLLSDVLLTGRKLEKHLGGEALEDRYVEELIGKTWRKDDRAAVDNLHLLEYAFASRTTADGFLIRESRFVDLASGEHFSEKQILPAFLVKRTPPKRSHAGYVLVAARGGRYPGFAPVRLDLEDPGQRTPVDARALERLLAVCLPSVGSALAAFQERRKDVFAPPRLAVALRTDLVLSRPGKALLVDPEGQALHLPADLALEERLASLLREGKLRALLGDVDIESALPTLSPLAVVFEGPLGLELSLLRSANDAAPGPSSSWARAAREAGASTAAVSLAEVREELAFALVAGLATLVPRTTDPLAARLRDVGLEKQAALLDQIARRADPGERLDDTVKLYQILEIALVRLLAAVNVDRAALARVPTFESVYIQRPSETLPPVEVAARRQRGELTRYEAAVHNAAYYESLPPEQLAASIFPVWADGSASPFVVRAFASRGEMAVLAARRALSHGSGRVARMTAVRVLEAVGSDEARALLLELRERDGDLPLRMLVADALDALAWRSGAPVDGARHAARAGRRLALEEMVSTAGQREERMSAIYELVQLADRAVLPALREAYFADASHEVREVAAHALGRLLDVEMVDTFVRAMAMRMENETAAKAAAYALGYLGDARGLEALLAAWAEGWKPAIVGDALRAMGAVALEPLLLLVEERPDLAARKAALDVFKQTPPDDLAAVIIRRLESLAGDPAFILRAPLLLKVASLHSEAEFFIARRICELLPQATTKEEKALSRAAHKRMGAKAAES